MSEQRRPRRDEIAALDDDDFPPLSDERLAEIRRETAGTGAREQARRMREGERAQRQETEAEMSAAGLDPATGERRDERPAESRTPGRAGSLAGVRRGAAGVLAETPGATWRLVTGKPAASLSSIALGILGYAIAENFLQGGWPQVKGWLGAKFANSPYSSSPSSSGPSSAAAPTATVHAFPSGEVVAPRQGAAG